ncbi:MAG: ornithine cyclodeaminase [Pseudomonadota bacterium]
MTPFVSVDNMVKLVRHVGVETFLTELCAVLEEDFARWPSFDKSPRHAVHVPGGVIELMPIADDALYSFKYVNGHPPNMKRGLQTVAAFGVLSDVEIGYPLLFSEMTILTALRTAAMSAVAAKHLAPSTARSMALIGNGAQSEFQAMAFRGVLGVKKLRLYDIDPAATKKALANLQQAGFDIETFSTAEEAVLGADIITTATADKKNATILSGNMVGPGQYVNGVGGDCPGKTELHVDVLKRGDIYVEYEPQTRIEGDVQQLPKDYPVTELWRVIGGEIDVSRDAGKTRIFDSVGFAIADFSALRYVHQKVLDEDLFDALSLIPDPADPRDLYGMIQAGGA